MYIYAFFSTSRTPHRSIAIDSFIINLFIDYRALDCCFIFKLSQHPYPWWFLLSNLLVAFTLGHDCTLSIVGLLYFCSILYPTAEKQGTF